MLQVMMSLIIMLCLFVSGYAFSGSNISDENDFNLIEVDVVSLLNPLGFSLTARGFRRQVYKRDQSPLWDGLYYQAGAQLRITPAFSRIGMQVEWMPIAIMQLRAEYDRLYFSGRFGSLLSFSSSDEPFDDDVLDDREGDEISSYGTRSAAQLTLRVKFSDTIVRNVTAIAQYKFPGIGPFYLEREYELLMATSDEILSNQLFLLFENKSEQGSRYIGPYHDYVHVNKSDLIRERIGMTWLQQYIKPIAGLQNPRWYIQSGIYLQDPNREDEMYLLIGVGGDIEF